MDLMDIKHEVTGAVLLSVNANTLVGADLRGAYLGSDSIIDAGQDSRGYRFVGCLYLPTDELIRPDVSGEWLYIQAGCRWFP